MLAHGAAATVMADPDPARSWAQCLAFGHTAAGTARRDAGVRDNVKVMIGGAPVTAEYATEIGADGFSSDAAAAVRLARSLVA